MSEIYSNTFTTTVNKVVVEQTSKNTRIDIYKGTTPLVAVNTTPTTGQYKVTITDTTNCTANWRVIIKLSLSLLRLAMQGKYTSLLI